MSEVERIRQQIAGVEAQQQQAEQTWQRCAGALCVLRGMLGQVQQEEDAEALLRQCSDRNGDLLEK